MLVHSCVFVCYKVAVRRDAVSSRYYSFFGLHLMPVNSLLAFIFLCSLFAGLSDILSVCLIVSLFLCQVEWLEVCSLSGHLSHSKQPINCLWLSLIPFWQWNILRWIQMAYEECVRFLSDALKAFSHKAHDYMLLRHVLDFLYEQTLVFLRNYLWVKAKKVLGFPVLQSQMWWHIFVFCLWFFEFTLNKINLTNIISVFFLL